MPIAVSATRLATQIGGGSERQFTLTADPPANATLILSIGYNFTTQVVTDVVDAVGNRWTQLADTGDITSSGGRVYFWVCQDRGLKSGDWILLRTSNTSFGCLALDAVTGLGTAHAPDKTATGSSTTNVTAVTTGPTAATAYANELCWYGLVTNTAAAQSFTSSSGFTLQGARLTTSGMSFYVYYKIVAAIGAQSSNGTLVTTASKYTGLLITLPEPQSPEATRRQASFVAAEVAYTGTRRATGFVGAEVASLGERGVGFVGAEVANATRQGAAGFVGAEIAMTGQNSAAGFVGVEIAHTRVGAAAGFAGAEVAYTRPAVAIARRPTPQIVG